MSLLAIHRGQDPHTPAPAKFSNVDRSFVVRRLQKNAATLVAAHPRSEYLGPDELVENIARTSGFQTTDLAILLITIGPERHTLVCVPERVWHGGRKHDLLKLKRIAGHAGRSCILVPEAAIQRQPRLATSRVIEDATGVQVSLEQRMAVLIHLIERGSSTLFDCACVMNHPSPFSAILHLVAVGVVKMESDSTLSPETKIELPDRLIGVT